MPQDLPNEKSTSVYGLGKWLSAIRQQAITCTQPLLIQFFVAICSVLPNHQSCHLGWVKFCFRQVKISTNHIEIVCVTRQKILKMGVSMGAM